MKQRKNGGFTLVELVVSMGIAITIIGLTCTILISSFRFFSRENDTTQAKMITDTVLDYMEDNLRYATALSIVDTEENLPADANTYCMMMKNGALYQGETAALAKAKDVYGETFYQGMKIDVFSKITEKPSATVSIGTKTEVQNQWLTLRLEIRNRQGELLYQKEKTLELVNLTANIESAAAGTVLPEKNLRILGNVAKTTETKNAIFCYDVKKVNHRNDYVPSPATMYNQVMTFVALPQADKETELTKLGISFNKGLFPSNDKIRTYIRLKYYGGEWPKLKDYIDVAKYGITYGGTNYLSDIASKDLRLTFHFDTATKSCVMFGIISNNTVELTNWMGQFVYVPDDAATFTNGYWYTYYPTKDTITTQTDTGFDLNKLTRKYSSLPALYNSPRYGGSAKYTAGSTEIVPKTLEEYYKMLGDYWNIMKTSD